MAAGGTADDPRQHARQRRAVARRVLLAMPPPGDPERGPVARPRAGADIRPTHGVHPLRNHRCRRPAELARATGAAERRWHRTMAMSRDQRRALRLLAGSPLGVTEAIMLAHGFTTEMLTVLVRDGLATATPQTVHAGKRPVEVVRVRITDAGRQVLAG
jgi:hypothetical protein